MKALFITVFLCCAVFPSYGRVALYGGKPVVIDLPLKKDVVLRFDEPQRVGASSEVKSKIKIRPNGNFVTLNTSVEEGISELIFQGLTTGKVVYVRAASKPVDSYYDDEITIRFLADQPADKNESNNTYSNFSPREIVASLTRSMAQSFGVQYALEDAAIAVKNVPTHYKLAPVPGLYKQQGVLLSPIKTLHAGGVYGTAFLFENKSTEMVEIDPKKFRGKWIALDILSSDTVLRPSKKTIITLVHLKPLPTNINDVVLGGINQ